LISTPLVLIVRITISGVDGEIVSCGVCLPRGGARAGRYELVFLATR
jgi:hypothetical protein